MSRAELLREPALLGLLARDVISTTGTMMTWVALPWFVLTTTGSATRMAIVVAVQAAGYGVAGFASSNVAGRLGARRTMVVADAARAPLVALIPLLHVSDLLSFPLLLVLVLALGAFNAPAFAARSAILPEIVGEDEGALGEANALFQASSRATMILGPVLGGALIAVVETTAVLLIDAATFLVGFLLILLFVRVNGKGTAADQSRGLTAGVRFLLSDRLLRPWFFTLVIGDVAWLSFFVAVRFLVLTRFGDEPQIVGWIVGGFGFGALAGSALVLRIIRRTDRLLLGSIGELAMVAPLWLFLADVPPWLLVAAMVTSGLANGLVNAPVWTIFTVRTPPQLRMQVFAATTATTQLLGPLALLGTGPALDTVGTTETLLAILVVLTAAYVVFTTAGLRERFRPAVTAA